VSASFLEILGVSADLYGCWYCEEFLIIGSGHLDEIMSLIVPTHQISEIHHQQLYLQLSTMAGDTTGILLYNLTYRHPHIGTRPRKMIIRIFDKRGTGTV